MEALEGEEAIHFLRLKFESLAQTEVNFFFSPQSEDFKKETVASGGSTMLPDVPDPLKLKAELEREEKAEKEPAVKPDAVPQVKVTAEEEQKTEAPKKKDDSKSSEGGSKKKKDDSKSGSEKSGEKPGLLGLLEDFNRKSQTYDPILLEAVKANDVAKVKKLFADPYPPDVDVRDTNGRTGMLLSLILSLARGRKPVLSRNLFDIAFPKCRPASHLAYKDDSASLHRENQTASQPG